MKKPGNAGGAKARQEGGCVESMTKQEELSKVEETPKQGREAESQKWSWVEAEVWTTNFSAFCSRNCIDCLSPQRVKRI